MPAPIVGIATDLKPSFPARRKALQTESRTDLSEARQNIRAADILAQAQSAIADPDAVKRSYRDALRKQLAEIDKSMQGLQRGLVPPERMARLLEEMLTRGHGLQLVALRSLPAQRFEAPGAACSVRMASRPRPGWSWRSHAGRFHLSGSEPGTVHESR